MSHEPGYALGRLGGIDQDMRVPMIESLGPKSPSLRRFPKDFFGHRSRPQRNLERWAWKTSLEFPQLIW
jgi:hypothetical protein